jgi:hypothetical protein
MSYDVDDDEDDDEQDEDPRDGVKLTLLDAARISMVLARLLQGPAGWHPTDKHAARQGALRLAE